MLADCLTRDMEATQLLEALRRRTWCITYQPEFVKHKGSQKQRSAPTAPEQDAASLPGGTVDKTMVDVLQRLSGRPGWLTVEGVPAQVAHHAKAFRTPEPRWATANFPRWSTYARFVLADGSPHWRRLEAAASYLDMLNQHRALPQAAAVLVTFSNGCSRT